MNHKTKPPVNWWFAQTLEGISPATPCRSSKFDIASLSQAATQSGCLFFCLLILATRERVYVLFHTYLVVHIILLQLVLYVFLYYAFVFPYRIYIIPSTPKIISVLLLLRYPTNCAILIYGGMHMYMVRTCLCFYYFYFLFVAQLTEDFAYIFLYLTIYYLPSILRRKYYVIFAPIR